MNLYVGTSGYAYKAWKGKFYPPDLPDSAMLSFYSEHFRSVEINNTFYRMPRAAMLERWAGQVHAGFKFALKAPQRITHVQRFKDAEDSVSYLLTVAAELEDRLGPLLFQTPPNFKLDLDRLREFLRVVPSTCRAAFEFRHESWFTDEAFGLLRGHNAALCIAEAENNLHVPVVSTADWGYLRLRRPDYREKDLANWATRIRRQNWRDAFVFFKHEDEAKGPAMATRFLELAGERRKSRLAA